MTPRELEQLADLVAERVAERLQSHLSDVRDRPRARRHANDGRGSDDATLQAMGFRRRGSR